MVEYLIIRSFFRLGRVVGNPCRRHMINLPALYLHLVQAVRFCEILLFLCLESWRSLLLRFARRRRLLWNGWGDLCNALGLFGLLHGADCRVFQGELYEKESQGNNSNSYEGPRDVAHVGALFASRLASLAFFDSYCTDSTFG